MRWTGVIFLVGVSIAACGEHGPKRQTASARIVNGGTAEAPAPVIESSNVIAYAGPPIIPEYWAISPEKVKATLLEITFINPSGSEHVSPLTGCEVTYDRSAPSLSTLLDCPFTVDKGTYTSLRLAFSSSFKVLVNDPAHAIYSDPAAPLGFASSAPAGGAQMSDFVVVCAIAACDPVKGQTLLVFAQPLVVGDDPVQLTVVMHGLHTIQMKRTAGAWALVGDLRNGPPVYLMPSVTGVAHVDFYSSLNIAGNVDVSNDPRSPPIVSFFVFYDTEGPTLLGFTNRIISSLHPMYPCNQDATGKFGLGYAQAASPTGHLVSDPNFRPGGYLGRDASGTVGWALTTDNAYKSYLSLWSMPEVTTPGGTTTLKCLATPTVPAPLSGDTYASGVPPIPSPTATITMRLVAR